MTKATRYPPELRERAMRLVREHRDEHPSEWAAIASIEEAGDDAGDVVEVAAAGCCRPSAVAGRDERERERIRELEREVRELRRANEILKAASAFFARELDPHWSKP